MGTSASWRRNCCVECCSAWCVAAWH
jgi:hypothetical protein